jgi:hypothetical protein
MGTSSTVALFFITIMAFILIGIVISLPIQWLWNNALVGSIDGINLISFWEAYGIFLLVNLIKPNYKTTIKK